MPNIAGLAEVQQRSTERCVLRRIEQCGPSVESLVSIGCLIFVSIVPTRHLSNRATQISQFPMSYIIGNRSRGHARVLGRISFVKSEELQPSESLRASLIRRRQLAVRNGRRLRLPSAYLLCIIEYALSNREAQWRGLKAKTNEMQFSTPRPACLRSAVLPLPQLQRYQNKLASPRELCLRTSRLKMI
jgi:hypothetical protein